MTGMLTEFQHGSHELLDHDNGDNSSLAVVALVTIRGRAAAEAAVRSGSRSLCKKNDTGTGLSTSKHSNLEQKPVHAS